MRWATWYMWREPLSSLATPRLLLRPWRDDDLDPFAAMCADPEVMRHFPALLSRDDAAAMIVRMREHHAREGFGLWAVEVPGVAPFVGFVGLMRPRWRPEVVEVGWRLARAHWKQGFASEGARAAIHYGFTTLGLDEIVSFVVPANTPSQAVMGRLGMVRDPSADFEHPSIPEGHPLRPHWLFRLPKRPV